MESEGYLYYDKKATQCLIIFLDIKVNLGDLVHPPVLLMAPPGPGYVGLVLPVAQGPDGRVALRSPHIGRVVDNRLRQLSRDVQPETLEIIIVDIYIAAKFQIPPSTACTRTGVGRPACPPPGSP